MKSILTITTLTFLFSLFIFSQVRNHVGVLPDKLTSETSKENFKPNIDGLVGFKSNDAKTTINKTLLGNGFLLIESIAQAWEGSAWGMAYIRSLYMYDGNHNQTKYLQQYWDSTAWVNGWKHSYAYDGNNNQTEYLSQLWDSSGWANFSKESYTFNTNNNRTEYLSQYWDGYDWVNEFKDSIIYDMDNHLSESLIKRWIGSDWENYYKTLYTVDGNNNVTESLGQYWDGSVWVISGKTSFLYDENNNYTEYLNQIWDGSAWVNNQKYSFIYDGSNNQTEYLSQTWTDSTWVNNWKFSSTYDSNNNCTETLYQTWDGSAWVNLTKSLNTYAPATMITTLTTDIPAGSQTLEVGRTEGFSIGDNIIINLGGVNEETNVIVGFGSILLQTPLQFNHLAGEQIVNPTPTSIEEKYVNTPNDYAISQNYPNPFNPSTKLSYSITKLGLVTLKVYDVLGTEIEILINEEKSVGTYELNWNASNLPSGVYFYRLQAGDFVQTRKMILLK